MTRAMRTFQRRALTGLALFMVLLLPIGSNLCLTSAVAQVPSKSAVLEPDAPYKKVALVIGNSAYQSRGMAFAEDVAAAIGNDATDMQAALSNQGFDVTLKRNLTRAQMVDAIIEFKNSVMGSRGVALFYYSGHGVEYDSNNYILPVDTFLVSKGDIPTQTINVNNLITSLRTDPTANSRINIFLLDACRDMPAEARSKGIGRSGLATIQPPNGTAIGFATAPGTRTADLKLNQRNSTYTAALLKYIARTNLRLDELFGIVRNEVLANTSQVQEPWSSLSVNRTYYFNPVWQIQGTWKSDKTGSIFKIRRRAREVVILMGVPSQQAAQAGYKEDDITFTGTIKDDDIIGQVPFKWSDQAIAKCPNFTGNWHRTRTGKISPDGSIAWTEYEVKYNPTTCQALNGDPVTITWHRWQ